AGALVAQLHALVLDADTHGLAGLVARQHVAVCEVVPRTLDEDDHIVLAAMGPATGFDQAVPLASALRIAGKESRGPGALAALHQAVADAHFLAAAADHQGGDVALRGQYLGIIDFLCMDTEEVTALRVGIGLAAAVQAIGRDMFVHLAAGIYAV